LRGSTAQGNVVGTQTGKGWGVLPQRPVPVGEHLTLRTFTESQNHRTFGLQGTSVGHPVQPPAEAGSPTAGCTGPRPGRLGFTGGDPEPREV